MGEAGHTRRLSGWDYSKGTSFFITIATEPRRTLFGKIEHGKMRLSPLGEEVKASLERMPLYSPGISLFGHVVMPDHVHFNVHLAAGLKEPLKVLGAAIRSFKNHTTKAYKAMYSHEPAHEHDSCAASTGTSSCASTSTSSCASTGTSSCASTGASSSAATGIRSEGARAGLAHSLWQQGYHDHLCLSRRFIDSTERYIVYNVPKWELMYGCNRRLHIIEPLDSPRLDAADYWKGVGNLALLDPERPMVSLRVSRRARDIPAVVQRMESAVAKGYAIISGFISPGERAVLEMLLKHPKARFIRMRPSCIPNARFRPESAYIDAITEDRYLEIARGNDETDFGRSACLNLNDEIIRIACAGNGLAVYFTGNGLKVAGRGE